MHPDAGKTAGKPPSMWGKEKTFAEHWPKHDPKYDLKAAEKGEYGPYVKPKYVPKPSDEEQMEMFGYIVADMIDFRLKALDNDVDTIEDYLENKRSRIDINWYDSMGLTTVMWTSMKGYKEVTKLLMKHGADLTLKDKVSNRDAVMWAQYGEQDADFINMLQKDPKDLSPRGEPGEGQKEGEKEGEAS